MFSLSDLFTNEL